MPELLIELLSEEIPARMQARAAEDLARLVTEGLKAQGLEAGAALAFATPRRLALVVEGVPEQSRATNEERKGPRVGAPEPAIQGFLKASGLRSLDQATVVKDDKRGDYYMAHSERPGRAAAAIIAEVVPAVMRAFPWPKSMRWGSQRQSALVTEASAVITTETGEMIVADEPWFRWVRPLHSIVCLLDGKVVPFEIAGIASGNATRGHRFHSPEPFEVTGFKDYGTKLKRRHVLLPASERAAMIAEQAQALATKHGLALVENEALLAENAGLTEWPTVLMGTFDQAFLDMPPEVLITSMRTHQKCFALRDPATDKLASRFLLVSNLEAKDGGKAIIAGNEKVIRARLSDARFFWEQDLKKPLDEMAVALAGITFHEKLGSQKDRVERIAELAFQIAESVDADKEDARRAAQLCKADLVSGMVGEFPELQGLMGRYYAEAGGIKPETARAIELHYKPRGQSDTVPMEEEGDSVAIAVALADRLDTLVGFWAMGEKPTGSGDPYQLRRAALGVIRIVLENDLRLALLPAFGIALAPLTPTLSPRGEGAVGADGGRTVPSPRQGEGQGEGEMAGTHVVSDLLAFFADRLKVHLREKGARHDLIDAVFALPGQDDLALIVKRVEALGEFLQTDDGVNLLAGVKRAGSILAIEEKKHKASYAGHPDGALLKEPQEKALFASIEKVKFDTNAAIAVENFAGAMRALAELRAPVDAFFDKVTVNADDPKLRENRLRLLAEIRDATLTVADFSRIAGWRL